LPNFLPNLAELHACTPIRGLRGCGQFPWPHLWCMGKNLVDLRFAVADVETHACSLVWRLWMTKFGDVYVATRDLAGVTKYSFHKSGICRDAFTAEHGRPANLPDRAVAKWQRPDVPAKGLGQFARLLSLAAPTDYLSKKPAPPAANITAIRAAPAGHATVIEVGLVSDCKSTLEEAMQRSTVPYGILAFAPAYDGFSLIVRWHHAQWENQDMNIPAAPKQGADATLQFRIEDGLHERPIRLVFHVPVKDRESLMLTELGGRVAPGQEHLNWVARSPGVIRDPFPPTQLELAMRRSMKPR
jgi:hypothetical protein